MAGALLLCDLHSAGEQPLGSDSHRSLPSADLVSWGGLHQRRGWHSIQPRQARKTLQLPFETATQPPRPVQAPACGQQNMLELHWHRSEACWKMQLPIGT